MPRKQNGFGNAKSFGLKPFKSTEKSTRTGKGGGPAPSERRFGSTIHKSIIDKYNINSDWVKWRKGFEYYNQMAWYELDTFDPITENYTRTKLFSKLYQGTDDELSVKFEGYKFSTQDSDSNNHYVMKRIPITNTDIGSITTVKNDPFVDLNNKLNNEIWCTFSSGPNYSMLLQMLGERIDDGETEATISYVLNSSSYPAIYNGKSEELSTTVEVTIDIPDLDYATGVDPITNYSDLVNQIVFVPGFFVNKNKTDIDNLEFNDDIESFTIDLTDSASGQTIQILNRDDFELPPSLFDISQLNSSVSTTNGTYEVKGKFSFDKNSYQRFFGRRYLTAGLVDSNTNKASYAIMPFSILGVEVINNKLILKSVPARTELKLTSDPANGTIIFSDNSFTKTSIDSYDGEYYHNDELNADQWKLYDTDIDPWMDEVFTSGNALKPSTLFSCSCPNYSKSLLSAPQSTQNASERKVNRQQRYPLPSAMSPTDYEMQGRSQVAGKVTSWERSKDKLRFKMCKHTIAARFIEHIKTKEPNEYPTVEIRENFDEKLSKEIKEVADRFAGSYKRGGITTLELIFALGQGLNLDDVEIAYVLFGTKF